jgi:putative hydrolase of the HAD superfamily
MQVESLPIFTKCHHNSSKSSLSSRQSRKSRGRALGPLSSANVGIGEVKMAPIKAVFFDAAGTLLETREPVGESYARIARGYGVDATAEAVNAAFRSAFRDASPLAFGPGLQPHELRRLERDWWSGLVAKTFAGIGQFTNFHDYFDSLFEFFADPANWVADCEALSTLSTLRERGLTLGVISNFDHRLYSILDGLGLRRCFDSITISSEAGSAKPSAKIFEIALRRHRLVAGEALHVGDSEHLDVAGAAAAGLPAVLVNPKLRERISITGRVAQVSTLREVANVIGRFDGT